jgi:hypothetical protein
MVATRARLRHNAPRGARCRKGLNVHRHRLFLFIVTNSLGNNTWLRCQKKQIEAVPVEESVAADTDRPANGSDRVALHPRRLRICCVEGTSAGTERGGEVLGYCDQRLPAPSEPGSGARAPAEFHQSTRRGRQIKNPGESNKGAAEAARVGLHRASRRGIHSYSMIRHATTRTSDRRAVHAATARTPAQDYGRGPLFHVGVHPRTSLWSSRSLFPRKSDFGGQRQNGNDVRGGTVREIQRPGRPGGKAPIRRYLAPPPRKSPACGD